ncbi:hypothetical protein ACFOPN_12055 [Xanthomonas hyacinthi]|uniref:hypothetical protein n=1 Tax=Xanthomonas hyacinthi TaxID=56455 RepID=UPI0036158F36
MPRSTPCCSCCDERGGEDRMAAMRREAPRAGEGSHGAMLALARHAGASQPITRIGERAPSPGRHR